MVGQSDPAIVLLDSATAATLAQILPVLLLTLAVELRRNQLHQSKARSALAAFFVVFGIVETVLVMSIDGAILTRGFMRRDPLVRGWSRQGSRPV